MKTTKTSEVLITETNLTTSALYVAATCGATSALVVINEDGVRVICNNAAHQVWKGSGKFFATIAEALAGYKSPAMKAIIAAADAINH